EHLDAGVVGSGASALKRFRASRVGGMSLPDFGFYVLCATAVVLLAAQAAIHPTEFVQIFIFGLTQGSIYALVALGCTLVSGLIELINFAHGVVFTLDEYGRSAIPG